MSCSIYYFIWPYIFSIILYLFNTAIKFKRATASKAYGVFTAQMNLWLLPPPQNGHQQSGEGSSFLRDWCTPLCGEMHGLTESTTAPLLSQEIAGTRCLRAACWRSHSNLVNLRRGIISAQRDLQWCSLRPQTVIDPFTFQEQFHCK